MPRQILQYVGHLALKRDENLPDIVMRREMVGVEKTAGQSAKRLQHTICEHCPTFGKNATSWTPIAQDCLGGYRVVKKGAKKCMPLDQRAPCK